MTSRRVKKLMISRSAKGAYTAPEIRFDEYQSSRKMNLIMNRSLDFVLPPLSENGIPISFTFQCDFLRQTTTGSFDVDYEIDGEGHKEKWDHWKDAIKGESGLKVIHIPGELTKEKWWAKLDEMLPQALLDPKMSVYLDEYSK